MEDVYNYLATAVEVIRSDSKLRDSFMQVLKFGPSTQQVRVKLLLEKVEELGAPDELIDFVRLLGNDKLAERILTEIE